MANYICAATRSNYFKVTDKQALKDLIARIVSEDTFNMWELDEDRVAFGAYGSIDGLRPCEALAAEDPETAGACGMEDEGAVYGEIQALLPVGEACIITSVGNEKLRYIGADSVVITHDRIENVNLLHAAVIKATKILKNKDWGTRMEY